MKSMLLTAALFAAGVTAATSAMADFPYPGSDAMAPTTVAVFGDWPYNQLLLDNASLLIDSVNADRKVGMVIHVGDIHGGSSPCTSAGILPPIATSNPGWNQGIFHQFQQFRDPLVYTPGDNEWTDCHKSKEKSSGDPLKELASIRSLFFAKPGHTLGLNERARRVAAADHRPRHPGTVQLAERSLLQRPRDQLPVIRTRDGFIST